MNWINNTSSDHLNNKALQEQHHVVTSIDWKVILQKPEGEQTIFTPKSARIYIANVVRRMNSHFGIFMNGADIGRLRISIFDFLIYCFRLETDFSQQRKQNEPRIQTTLLKK